MGGYAASKYVGRAISEVLRLEVPKHVQVGAIYPGGVQSELGGSKEMTQIGMPADEFIDIIWPRVPHRLAPLGQGLRRRRRRRALQSLRPLRPSLRRRPQIRLEVACEADGRLKTR